ESIEKAKSTLQEQHEDLLREQGTLTKEKKLLEKVLSEKLAKISELEKEIIEYEQATIRVKDSLKNVGSSETIDLEQLREKYKKLQIEYEKSQGVIAGLDLKIISLEKRKQEKENELAELAQHCTKLEEEKKKLETQNIKTEKKLRQMETEFNEKDRKISELNQKITDLEREKGELQAKIRELEQKILDQEKELVDL